MNTLHTAELVAELAELGYTVNAVFYDSRGRLRVEVQALDPYNRPAVSYSDYGPGWTVGTLSIGDVGVDKVRELARHYENAANAVAVLESACESDDLFAEYHRA